MKTNDVLKLHFKTVSEYRISLIKMRPCLECARIRDKKEIECALEYSAHK